MRRTVVTSAEVTRVSLSKGPGGAPPEEMRTVPFSSQERGSPEHKPPRKTQQTAKKTVRVFVRGKRNTEIDCVEITLEAVPVQTKSAWQ